MPRVARKDYNTSFFHIMVQGIRKEYIFNSNEDKEKYTKLMSKYLEKYNIKIIAYCVMSNHAHILIYFEDIKELSEYMRTLNTTYAMYYSRKYKRAGFVFRNRYKTEPIHSERYLINCIHYIHDNPVKANICKLRDQYKYSSYYEYKFKHEGIINDSLKRFIEINYLYIGEIFENKEIKYNYMDYEDEIDFLDKEDVITEFLTSKGIKKYEIKENSNYLKEIAVNLNKKCGITHKEIADEFGVSRTRITKLINKK